MTIRPDGSLTADDPFAGPLDLALFGLRCLGINYERVFHDTPNAGAHWTTDCPLCGSGMELVDMGGGRAELLCWRACDEPEIVRALGAAVKRHLAQIAAEDPRRRPKPLRRAA